MAISNELETMLHSNGASIVGFADLRTLPPGVRKNMPYGISIAIALTPSIVSQIVTGPTREYSDEYDSVNNKLDSLGNATVDFLRAAGWRAHFTPATDAASDAAGFNPASLTTPLPHKTVATRAGLGWIGKCALLVTRDYGPSVRITSVLTDAELPFAPPVDSSSCGACTECVDICPAHAPKGELWQAGLPRDEFFDALACRANARKMTRERLGLQKSICGMCIAACPWTKKYLNRKA